jgi:hypothetical protein
MFKALTLAHVLVSATLGLAGTDDDFNWRNDKAPERTTLAGLLSSSALSTTSR